MGVLGVTQDDNGGYYRDSKGNAHLSYTDAANAERDMGSSSKPSGPSDAQVRADADRSRLDAERAAEKAKLDAELTASRNQRWAEEDKLNKQIDGLLDESMALYDKNEYDKAIAVIENAMNIAQKNEGVRRRGDFYALRARCFIEKGNLDKALEDINAALFTISPDQDKRYRYLMNDRVSWNDDKNKWMEEEKEWENLIRPFNTDFVTSLYIFRGLIYEKKGDTNKTVADFKKAADWDWCQAAYRKEKGSKETGIDLIGALRRLKERGVEYTPQMPYFIMQWEHWKPKESSFTKISTADVTATAQPQQQSSTDEGTEEFKSSLKYAEMGHADSMCDVAEAYIFGKGIKKDFNKAQMWITKASETDAFYKNEVARLTLKLLDEMDKEENQSSSPAPQPQASSTPIQKITYNDGSFYEGEMTNGQLNGKGKMTFANGDVYEGDWVNNSRTGKGKHKWANGDVYEGDWVNNNRTGKGKYKWSNGNVYEGDFVDGQLQGKGKQTFPNGIIQDGRFEKGNFVGETSPAPQASVGSSSSSQQIMNGKGTLKDNWGVYEGDIVNGKPHGIGKKTYSSGDIYEGEWKDGNRHGKGKMTETYGTVYEGDWKNKDRHGKGKITLSNGDIFEGDFVNNDGTGTMTFADGKQKKGTWKIGKFKPKGLFG